MTGVEGRHDDPLDHIQITEVMAVGKLGLGSPTNSGGLWAELAECFFAEAS